MCRWKRENRQIVIRAEESYEPVDKGMFYFLASQRRFAT